MIRIGILGCGRHGERYLRHLRRGDVQGAQVIAVYRRDRAQAERLAREYEVDVEATRERLLARDDVDAVVVATPPANHPADVDQLLAAGKPFLLEKPVAESLAAAQRLVDRVRQSGQKSVCMMAHTMRFNPALIQARTQAAGLGTVHRLRAAQRLEPSDLAWQRDRTVAGGGSVILTGVHLFDLFRWWVGRTPDAVQCRWRAVEGVPLENLFDACFEFEAEQLLASAEVSKFSASRSGLLEAVGTAGQLWCDYVTGTIEEIRGRERTRLHAFGDVPTIPATLLAFARAVREEIEPPISLGDGLETLRMVDACYRSHQEQRRVRIT